MIVMVMLLGLRASMSAKAWRAPGSVFLLKINEIMVLSYEYYAHKTIIVGVAYPKNR